MGTATQRPRSALFAGGGSGGHVFPGLAVAAVLVEREWRVSWLGRREGIERELVEGRGVRYLGLPARAMVGRGLLSRAGAVWTLARSSLAARRLIRRQGFSVVVGTGGYVSAPGVLGARLSGRPCLLLEPNAEPGAATRWLSRWAALAATGFEGSAAKLRCPARHTGTPVRRSFFSVPPLRPEGVPRLLVIGGSQGARQLNLLLPPTVARLRRHFPGLEVVHQVGSRWVEETRAAYAGAVGPAPDVTPFIEDMAGEMARSWLIVSRAGAITLAEICAAGRGAVLIPLALAGAHQRANAARVVEVGGAVLAGGDEVNPEVLGGILSRLLGAPGGLDVMGERARSLAVPDASSRIATLVERLGEAA